METQTEHELYCARNAQVSYLLQHLFDLCIELALGILISCVGIQILLNLGHSRVGFGAKAQLDLHEGLETGVQVGYAQVDQLGQLGGEHLIQLVVCSLGHLFVLLGARQLGHILVGFVGQFLDLGAGSVVVEGFVIALRDAAIDVGEVGAEALDGIEDGGAVGPVEGFDGLGVEVGDGLLVGAGDAVFGAGVAVESVNGLSDAHLRGRHGTEGVEVALCLFLELVGGGFHCAVATAGASAKGQRQAMVRAAMDAPQLRLIVAIVGALDLARFHEHLGRGAVDALLEACQCVSIVSPSAGEEGDAPVQDMAAVRVEDG